MDVSCHTIERIDDLRSEVSSSMKKKVLQYLENNECMASASDFQKK